MTSPLLTARLAHPGRLLTYREVAGQLNVALRTVQRAVSAGALPVVRLSPRTARVRPDDLAAWIDRGRSGGPDLSEAETPLGHLK